MLYSVQIIGEASAIPPFDEKFITLRSILYRDCFSLVLGICTLLSVHYIMFYDILDAF